MSDKVKVVISGVSGVFPESDNVNELQENLFAKRDLTTLDNRRWNVDEFKGNSKLGKINDLSKFDHSFFRIHRNHVNSITPASRILLEQAYEAIVDAGCNPAELKNTRTGVYIAITYNDWEHTAAFNQAVIDEEFAKGLSRSMIANRISYWLDIHGPSYVIDTACSSSLYALEQAYRDISSGICDAALVGGFSLCFLTNISLSYGKLGVLSMTGTCRPFDEAADGFVRGEAIVMIFLQKKENARRIYANVIHAKTNCDGYKEEGLTFPSGESHIKLYEEFYKEINMSPQSVAYIEAHGTATRIGDIVEVNAIEKFFCKDRKDALKIGSVKSTMGHAEACAGLCSLVKMIIAFESGLIPPNINLQKLNPKISGFYNGKIEVVTEAIPCNGEFFAVNSFGIGGSNAHVLLSPHTDEKSNETVHNLDVPQLVLISGRTEEAVDVLAMDLENNHSDLEYINLMREVFHTTIDGHLFRGYFMKPNEKEPIKSVKSISEKNRPLWFVFTGMGCQWPGMAKDLLRISTFSESIHKSHKILEFKGLDLMKIITEKDLHMFDNVLHSFVGIAAIQVALVDVLNAMEIKPDGIIGHSAGELGCGYADGCLTLEETILAAYYRGLVLIEYSGKGLMASIALKYDDLRKNLPPEIDIACHNTENNYTISGPQDIVEKYVKNIQSEGVWARHVKSSGIAFHSRYISSVGPKLLTHLEEVITNPKPRSEKWICTSAPKSQWEKEEVKYASAEYYTNNTLTSVYFEQGSKKIPSNAVVIEIAPHGLLQNLLQQSLPPTVENIPLTSKNHEDNLTFFLNSIGKAYVNGVNLNIKHLYPAIEFPVRRGTPMIAPVVRWQHDEDWFVPRGNSNVIEPGERVFAIDVKSEEHEYLKDHVVDDKIIFPGVEYLNLVWESVANIHGKSTLETAVVFEEVQFLRAIYISEKDIILHTSIQQGTGYFEVTENNNLVAKGRVYTLEGKNRSDTSICDWDTFPQDELPMKTKDIYRALRLKGFQYQGIFKNVLSASSDGTFGKLGWKNNLVAFMDSLTHLKLLTQDTSEVSVATFVQKLVIDPIKHFQILNTLDVENSEFPAYYNKNLSALESGGVQMYGLKFTAISRRKDTKNLVLEKYQFVPNFSRNVSDLDTAIRLCTQIVIENLQILKLRSIELPKNGGENTDELISHHVLNALSDWPLIQGDVSVLLENESDNIEIKNSEGINVLRKKLPTNKNLSIIIISDIFRNRDRLPKIFNALKENAFIITRERDFEEKSFHTLDLEVCFYREVGKEKIILLRKSQTTHMKIPPVIIKIENFSYAWISEIQKTADKIDTQNNQKIVLHAGKEAYSGILGFFNCLRKEFHEDIFRCFFVMDKNAPEFSLDYPLYESQFRKNLSHNVYKNGEWGSYRHLLLEPAEEKQCSHAFARVATRGDLSTAKWFEGFIKHSSNTEEESLLHVYCTALNHRDIVLATGKASVLDVFKSRIEEEKSMGFEVSGKNQNGERLMGIVLNENSVSSLVINDPVTTWKVPDDMTLEEAATIPIAYATAVLTLIIHGKIRKGHSVLIHAGSESIGIACLYICTHYECIIFTTVESPKKKEFIKKKFPRIPENQIGNSRDTSFEKMIMKYTNGKGVDLLVSTLAEDKFQASLRCVAKEGKFLRIDNYDMSKHTLIDSYNFLKAANFHCVKLDYFANASTEDKLQLRDVMQELIDSGVVKPLERSVFTPTDLESAMRYMATGKNIGKVMIKIRDEEDDIKCKPQPIYMNVYPRVMCNKNEVYIITGGLGGFGLELADWLILRGARIIILSSANGIKSGYQLYKVQTWKSYGVNVLIDTNDITTKSGVNIVLKLANSLGPVIGIFHLAVLLRDNPFMKQTTELFLESAGPKAKATIHLDQASRGMCPNLKHFVVFSSASCGRGNFAQTNYGMFNSVTERICEKRSEDNLPALAIQWGAVGDVGLVADITDENNTVALGGTSQQKIISCLDTLDLFMNQANVIVSSMVVAEKCKPYSNVVNVVANILGIKDLKNISLDWTLPQLGLDSMMAIELKNVLESEFEMVLTEKDIKTLTFNKLLAKAENDRRRQSLIMDEGISNALRKKFNEAGMKLPIVRRKSKIENSFTK